MNATTPPPAERPMADLVMRGAALMILLRFVVRAIGLVSVTITARLLTPEDFGIVGTAAIVTGLFAILTRIGAFDVLLRLREVTEAHVRTFWTINILVAALISAGIYLVAPLAARLLHEPRLTEVLHWMALTPFITSLSSPGQAMFARTMRFGHDFMITVMHKVAIVASVICFTLVTRDYWGLVYGSLTGAAIYAALSYAIAPFRVWPTLRGAREFFAFSAWSLTQSLAMYVAQAADEIVVRRMSTSEMFGLYHASRDLSRILVSELVAPTTRPVMAGLARLQDEERRFATAAAHASGVGAILAVSCGLGVSATAPEIVGIVLGPQWVATAPFLAFTAIGTAAQTLAWLHRSILAPIGRQDVSAWLWVLRAVLLLVCLGAVVPLGGGALEVAITFAVVSVLQTLFDYAVVFRRLNRPQALAEIFLRPVIAGAAMMAALALLPLPPGLPLVPAALAKVAVGGAVFVAVQVAAWWIAGRPIGAETALLNRCPVAIRRIFLRSAA